MTTIEAQAPATRFDGVQDAYVPPKELSIHPSLRLSTESADDGLDPITYEVLRHNLWSINEEHGITMLQVSGSPIAAYGCDFNPSLLTEDGEFVYFGPYLQFFSGMQDLNVKWILENRSENPGIEPDDMFLANDPWVGTNHQLDVMLAAPVFHEGELFCWVTNAMHFIDLGGSVPGGWNPAGQSMFEEPVATPPVKIVEGGRLRRDIEDMFTRRSRLPQMVALDLRAVIAGANVAKRRVLGLVERYGADVVKAVMRRIISNSADTFAQRMSQLPDGVWRERNYLEMSGPGDRNVYELALTLRKEGTRLTFDNFGTAEQVGSINVTYAGWRGAILSVINAFLTPDLLYAIGGAVRHIDFNPAPGTILTASPPAAVGCGSAIGCEATLSLANNAVARMMHPSPRLRRMYTANGGDTVWPIVSYGGIDQRGDAYQSIILDFYAAPIGAYQFRDGIDSAGPYWMAKTTSPNVEHNEQTTPILYLYRREMEDSPGAGRFVGGATIGVSFTAHKSDEILHQVATCGVTHPTATGLFGGMPGPPNTYRFKTGNGSVHDVVLRSDRLDPEDPDTRELSPKEANLLQRPGDIYEVICTGAAGFGDPLEREPHAVARDVDEGRYTRPVAERLFGVVFADGVAVDADATAERRRQIRLERLGAAREGRAYGGAPVVRLFGAVTDTLDAGRATDGSLVLCSRYSGAPLCAIEDNYKDGCARLALPVQEASPLGEDPSQFIDATIEFRLYLCPETGGIIETEVARAEDPPLHELQLDAESVATLMGSE
jgi:N-methylhydantoinase B